MLLHTALTEMCCCRAVHTALAQRCAVLREHSVQLTLATEMCPRGKGSRMLRYCWAQPTAPLLLTVQPQLAGQQRQEGRA